MSLWAQILQALETRIEAVNRYITDNRSQLMVTALTAESIYIQQPSSNRSIIAALDLKAHSIHLSEFGDAKMERVLSERDLPLSMLADGELYVTDGNELKANAMEVAKALIDALLTKKSSPLSA